MPTMRLSQNSKGDLMKTMIAMMVFAVSTAAYSAGGNSTVYGNTRYCIPSAGGAAAACGAIVNGASVSCDAPPATGCNIPGVGSGTASNHQNRKEIRKR